LVEPCPGVLERRSRLSLAAGLPEIVDRLLPQVATQGMMGELFDVFEQAVGIEPLDNLHDLPVKRLALIGKKTSIGDVVRERVLERMNEVWEETCFV
jgi:hypothetical protein